MSLNPAHYAHKDRGPTPTEGPHPAIKPVGPPWNQVSGSPIREPCHIHLETVVGVGVPAHHTVLVAQTGHR